VVPGAPPPTTAPDPATAAQQQAAAAEALGQIETTLQAEATLRASAARQVTNTLAEIAALEAAVAALDADSRTALARLSQARGALQRRAVASYVVAPAAQLNSVLDVVEFNELSRRIRMLAAVARADRAQLGEYQAAKTDAGNDLQKLVDTLARSRADLVVAEAFLRSVDEGVQAPRCSFAPPRRPASNRLKASCSP